MITPEEVLHLKYQATPEELQALRLEVLKAIAYGNCDNPRECARLVVEI